VRQKSELEQDIVSVERLQQYIDVAQEPPYEINENKPSDSWPSKGQIQFQNVYMRYREGLEHVLRGLSFEIKGGEKVGVIGRTGSGKSSMFLTLLRLVEIDTNMVGAKIVIDDVDINRIGLLDLRSRISVIPQDPVLFTGTLRSNLDPFGDRADEELIDALKYAHMWKSVEEMSEQVAIKKARDEEKKQMEEKKKEENDKQKIKEKEEEEKKRIENEKKILDARRIQMTSEQFLPDNRSMSMSLTEESRMRLMEGELYVKFKKPPLELEVEENGGNFSVGQRQLICLARAIVRHSRILLLDEATSAVDPSTDRLIQTTIRERFEQHTILAIAHRIDTILDYDKIMILEKGKVLEFDSPANMLNPNSKSRFVDIVQESFGVQVEEVLKQKIKVRPGVKDVAVKTTENGTNENS